MSNKKSVIVITFVWREMKSMEKMALKCGIKRLGKHPFAVVHPESYSIEYLKQEYPRIIDVKMSDDHFTSRDSYNEMMLMPDFYRHFQDYDFMLIYQLDAFVFRDELDYWVAQDYDYIGAPWLPSDSWFQRTIGRLIIRCRKLLPSPDPSTGHIRHADIFFEVGNGGFSLRKISTMIRILSENKEFIASFPIGSRARNEDIVISIILGKMCHLTKPDWQTAAHFSFETNPNHCFRVTRERLPFGCHAWDTSNWEHFWRGILWFEE